MGRYFGNIGFKITEEIRKGVFKELTVERQYYGDFMRNSNYRNQQNTESVNNDIIVQNTISILADPFIYDNFYNIQYIEVYGYKWKVSSIEVNRPRLIITTGGKFNESN